ncbi:protein-disulfide reductase DsbD domain-containing protein [Aestuariivita boseongensis]|uniref:protein-disulfide reductase DsbD domain-containing protein n=1 Tax=Aestuariivita boseongensis TaxID=1470562 RepID=UPI00067FDF80|nr:protein-disulfide reductase DsbD domain-containing protein [Aestuariivita boseongensis]
MRALKYLSLALAALIAPPVAAQGWIDDVVRVEVLDGGTGPDGLHRAAIRFVLADGWKTYWRAPGDAGIPPEFSWRGSRNVAATRMTWPTPKVFDQNGLRSVGYEHELVLPIDIEPSSAGTPLRLKGKVELGVCKDVCIPSTLKFDQVLDPNAPHHPAILAARSDRPFSAHEAGVTSAKCVISPTGSGLRVEAHIQMPHAGGAEFTVTESGDPDIWVSETQVQRRGDTLIATSDLMHLSAQSFALDRSALRFTVLGSNHAVDIQGCTAG